MKNKKENYSELRGMKILGIYDFASLFGIPLKKIPLGNKKLINELNFRDMSLDQDYGNKILLQVIETLNSDLPLSGKSRIEQMRKNT